MRRTVAIITAALLSACLLAGGDADAVESPTSDSCPAGTILDPVVVTPERPPGGLCICTDNGEVIGEIDTRGVFVPYAVEPNRTDSDGDCSTPYPAVPLEEEPQPEARTQQTAPTLPGEPVYPVPDVPQTGGGPVQARPGLTG